MKKIVRQQNYLRELIDTQGNKYLSRQALKCLIRSAVEPLLDAPETGVVLHRIECKEGLQGILKRLEFSEVEAINYTDSSNNLVELVWANTEFLCVMTHRYVSILIWDNRTSDKDFIRYYSLYNSKLQSEPLNIIMRNSKIDISQYIEKFNPDRRDNILLNSSVRRLIDNMDEAINDAVLHYAENNVETLIGSDYIEKKSRIIAHEIRNQLSICDLYSEIIKKQAETKNFDGIENSLISINKAIKMANNSLISLKTKENSKLKSINLNELITTAVELSQVYLTSKNIEFQIENNENTEVIADFEKTLAVIINIVKNASEAFETNIEDNILKNDKYIKIKTEKDVNFVKIYISNNAPGISEPEKIFNEGFTTKNSGSGLGLWICKKMMEEQNGELELSRSSTDYTEFALKLGV
jgi:signal transduction histidine kinase